MADRETASPTPAAIKLTYEDYVTLPEDGRRYEILDGELSVTPSPRTRHQIVSLRLAMLLETHVRAHDLGTVLPAPTDVILDDTTIVIPDIVFISKARTAIVTERAVEGAPDLIIEILSPTTEHRDRGAKLKLYAAFGVPHYWIVDAEEQTLEVRQLGDSGYELLRTCNGHDTLVSAVLPGLLLDLRKIWA